MKVIQTDDAAQPLGHYSQAIVHDNLVFISGQLGIDPNDTQSEPGDVESQTAQTLKNLKAILDASGSSINQVLKTTIFISDISYWGQVNQVYSQFFGDHKPARSAVPTKDLPKGFLVEIEAVACLN